MGAVAYRKPLRNWIYDFEFAANPVGGNVAEYVRPNVSLPDFVYIIGGGAQTSADAIGDIPMSKFDPKQRNRMVGFRIVVEYPDKKASK